jgi:thymidine kinase
MPWRDAISLPFTRIEIVSRVPSESGVYGIIDGDNCVFVGESWNLKARLLELAGVLSDVEHLKIMCEVCPDEDRSERKIALARELGSESPEESVPLMHAPGLLYSTTANR